MMVVGYLARFFLIIFWFSFDAEHTTITLFISAGFLAERSSTFWIH